MGSEGGGLQGVVRVKTGRIWGLIWEGYKHHTKDLMFYSVVNGETLNVFEQRIIRSELYCKEINLFRWKRRHVL